MAGSLNASGSVSGMLTGSKDIGPVTMTGKAIIGEIYTLEPEAGKDNTIKVPKESVAVLIAFTFESGSPEVKVRTNLNSADGGLPIPAQGWIAFPLYTGVTSIILHPDTATQTIELSFI